MVPFIQLDWISDRVAHVGEKQFLEHIAVYNRILPKGNRLHGKTITVINRSEVVGRPLAALLANDGAKVYSVDEHGIIEFHRGEGLKLRKHEVCLFFLIFSDGEAASPFNADIWNELLIKRGSPCFGCGHLGGSIAKLQSGDEQIKRGCVCLYIFIQISIDTPETHDFCERNKGVIAINFSSSKNFQDDILQKASIFVPSVGKVTVAMLERNLVRLFEYQMDERAKASLA